MFIEMTYQLVIPTNPLDVPPRYNFKFNEVGTIFLGDVLGAAIDGYFYLGQSFSIEEQVSFELAVTKPELLDVDFRYEPPHEYLGNYTIPTEEGLRSFPINYRQFSYSRITIFTITDIDNKYREYDVGNIYQCGLDLRPTPYPPLGFLYRPNKPNSIIIEPPVDPLFTVNSFRKPCKLSTIQLYNILLNRARIYTFPGVELVNSSILISAINTVQTVNEAYQPPECPLSTSAPTCDEEFEIFLVNNPGAYPNQDVCQQAEQSSCIPLTFTCSDGGTRQYWVAIQT